MKRLQICFRSQKVYLKTNKNTKLFKRFLNSFRWKLIGLFEHIVVALLSLHPLFGLF